MHKTSIHVSLKDIRGETHSTPRNHTKNKGTKNKHEKDYEIHNVRIFYTNQEIFTRPSMPP
jgi:hypothetical protein